ncbi:MAG TPA: GNAT family N-acetyltransferase [Acetobacteraceae bacterium]|jgi:N-acetylglutamate synthase-like GNAT family acetyltransferase
MTELAAMSASSTRGLYCLRIPESAEEWETYHRIRRDVLLEALKYAVELKDEVAPGHHPRLLCLDGKPIGSIRIDVVSSEHAALRLVAIDPVWQGQGHGATLLHLAEEFAVALGCTKTVVYATPEAAGFYSKAGFAEEDWDDAYVGGIVQMVKPLAPAVGMSS